MKTPDAIGMKVAFSDSKGKSVCGIVVDIQKGNSLVNIKTGVRTKNTWKLKIKPLDGGRAIWTPSMEYVGTKNKRNGKK